jgi:hypothetical protein
MVWWTALTQQWLDLPIAISRDLAGHIYERPGVWMSAEGREALSADLCAVAAAALPTGPLAYGIFAPHSGALDKAIITIIRDRATGRALAFNALSVMDVVHRGRPDSVTHLGLVLIDPATRGRGFSWALYGLTTLLLFARNQLRPLWISSVTQVPAVVGLVSEGFADVFPGPDQATRCKFDHLSLARQIMRRHRHIFGVGPEAGFDEERFVITNAYTGGSEHLKKAYEDAPPHRNAAYNEFCATQLDYDRGDDLLQIGQMNMDAARRYLTKDVPRASLPGLVTALLFLLVQRLTLPLVYWLTPSRQWGVLRPWRIKPHVQL